MCSCLDSRAAMALLFKAQFLYVSKTSWFTGATCILVTISIYVIKLLGLLSFTCLGGFLSVCQQDKAASSRKGWAVS